MQKRKIPAEEETRWEGIPAEEEESREAGVQKREMSAGKETK